MKWNLLLVWASCICMFYQVIEVDAVKCLVSNKTSVREDVKMCDRGCMAVWYNISNDIRVQYQMCWNTNVPDHPKPTKTCEGRTQLPKDNPEVILCHCSSDLCNANLTWVGYEAVRPTTNITSRPHHVIKNNDHMLYITITIVGTTLVLIVLFIMYLKKCREAKPDLESISKGSEAETLIPSEELPPIDLLDVLSQGQFCIVRKGRMGYKDVAVKIFPITQCSKPTPSALTETDIYMVCKLNHENILKFIGKHLQEDGNQQQLWLVTEYIEQGSLSDFLKRNTISWENLFHMAQGMAFGMAYLHAEIPRVKPSIAHRDIKSKNILVKNNLTCCISDFGLSLKFDNKDGPGDTHGQHGAFLRAFCPKIYACGPEKTFYSDIKDDCIVSADGTGLCTRRPSAQSGKEPLSVFYKSYGLYSLFALGMERSLGALCPKVGTRRYMAPEVLEGAINFSREAFLRIDMYAFALCLWELLTRCTAVQEEPVGDYKLPFEEDVGIHPTLEELQDFVVNKKLRPSIPAEWKDKDQAIDGIIETIEECWDHDADARLTADCVAERVKQFRAAGKRQTNAPISVSYKSLEQENALLA